MKIPDGDTSFSGYPWSPPGRPSETGAVYVSWVSVYGHGRRHVHVYQKGKFIVKWDLENDCEMRGAASKRVKLLIRELKTEGML